MFDARTEIRRLVRPVVLITCIAILTMLSGCVTQGHTPATRDLRNKESRTRDAASKTATPATTDKTLKTLEDAVAATPDDAEAHYRLANALFDLGRFEEACAEYNKVVTLNPQHAAALCNKGLCLRHLGKTEEALAAYRASLAIQPNDEITLQNTVVLLLDGDPNALLEPLKQLAAVRTTDVDVQAELAKALYRTGHFQDAITAFKHLIDLDPGLADDYYNLGLCYFDLEQYDSALTSWLTALAYDPKNPSARKGVAVAYWKRKDYDSAWKAVAECQKMGIAIDPGFLSALQKDSHRAGPSS